jgi:hypothetical protein
MTDNTVAIHVDLHRATRPEYTQWRRRLIGLLGEDDAEATKPKRKRKPPRLDPVKSAAIAVSKNPALVARIKTEDGEIEITAATAKAKPISHLDEADISLDASADDHVANAIAAIRNGGNNGRH